jgi:hypothetical protein
MIATITDRSNEDVTEQLRALRAKAARICAELTSLHRRVDDLHQQVLAHRRRCMVSGRQPA